ncbi:MAG: hypothetical protein HY840_03360 [Bacteroidetes bacterium]|nr:hypothetical protein [Bacteroidota bacterium]
MKREIKIRTLKKIALGLFLLLIYSNLFSQSLPNGEGRGGASVTATASLDTNAILIGKQAKVKLTVEYKTDQGNIRINFPRVADTLIKQIEVVGKSKIESYIPDSSDMNRLAQTQTIIITSFDSGYYAIPPFRFIINGDSIKSIETEPLLFSVNTIAVDTTIAIKDIKPPLEVPFNWKELLPYIYGGLGALAVLAGLIYLILYYIKKRKEKPVHEIIIPKIPAHVTALEQLEKLKEEKLWQQGKLKEYHSGLSDIIRQYIEHRFYIHAMEQVTDEIMYSFRTADVSEELKMKLRNILFLSDLVKFAKEQPLPNENEMSWINAYEFVAATKIETKAHPQPLSLGGEQGNRDLPDGENLGGDQQV